MVLVLKCPVRVARSRRHGIVARMEFSMITAQRIVDKMRDQRCSMAKACTGDPTLPSYDVARSWLVHFAEFRAIYPRRGSTWFQKLSEADIQRARDNFAKLAGLK